MAFYLDLCAGFGWGWCGEEQRPYNSHAPYMHACRAHARPVCRHRTHTVAHTRTERHTVHDPPIIVRSADTYRCCSAADIERISRRTTTPSGSRGGVSGGSFVYLVLASGQQILPMSDLMCPGLFSWSRSDPASCSQFGSNARRFPDGADSPG